MRYKHIISLTADTLIYQYMNISETARIVFFDLNNPDLVAIATKNNIDETIKQIPITKNVIFRIYELIDLSKSNTKK